jgi:hypothetical protein
MVDTFPVVDCDEPTTLLEHRLHEPNADRRITQVPRNEMTTVVSVASSNEVELKISVQNLVFSLPMKSEKIFGMKFLLKKIPNGKV